MATSKKLLFVTCHAVLWSGVITADDKSAPASGAATVENRVKEADLTTIKLTPEAEHRLGIELAPVEAKNISQRRQLPGELQVPPGNRIVLAAPIAGLLSSASSSGTALVAGEPVHRGDPLFRLQPGESGDGKPFVPADRISLGRATADLTVARIEAEGQLKQARVRMEAAQIKLTRADQLRQEGAGAQRAYDEARAELELATTERDAAQVRVQILSRTLESLESSDQAAIIIEAPLDATIHSLPAAPGQVVTGGAALVELVALDPLWVRVPVYVGEPSSFTDSNAARIQETVNAREASAVEVPRVTAPPSADPRAATVDLYFALPNADGRWRPGQRVVVELSATLTQECLTVPHSAILIDIYGGTWVYEATGSQTFVRRRVEVRDVVGPSAILSQGIAVGAKVVTSGAAELFGTEFGVGK